jgi:hypothetical protein
VAPVSKDSVAPENPNRHAGHREVASIRALWLEAGSSRASPAVCARGTATESARAEGTDVDEKKLRNEPNHGAGILANPEAVRNE